MDTSIINMSQLSETSQRLYEFSTWYADYHGYVSVCVCAVGVVCSVFVIIVLTRGHMINPTNQILTAMAVCDMLTMIDYIPFAVKAYCGAEESYFRATCCLFHANFSVTTHTASIWLGVVLAVFRFSVVTRPTNRAAVPAMHRRDLQRARLAVLLVLVLTIVILIPNYLSLKILRTHFRDRSNNESFYGVFNGEQALNYWIHALIIKLLPCALMSVFGVLLVVTVRSFQRRRATLRAGSGCGGVAFVQTGDGSVRMTRKRSSGCFQEPDRSIRTTWMLVAIIVLFLVTELPQGLLALVSGLRPENFQAYYIPLGDIFDICALVNNAVNFSLYCAMSKEFRGTFCRLFLPRKSAKPLGTNPTK